MSFENANLRCRNCKYWWPMSDGVHPANRERSPTGHCRRYAPPTLLKSDQNADPHHPSWAITLKDDWCGEHVHRDM